MTTSVCAETSQADAEGLTTMTGATAATVMPDDVVAVAITGPSPPTSCTVTETTYVPGARLRSARGVLHVRYGLRANTVEGS